jgi:hypothetical protein
MCRHELGQDHRSRVDAYPLDDIGEEARNRSDRDLESLPNHVGLDYGTVVGIEL